VMMKEWQCGKNVDDRNNRVQHRPHSTESP
jgi:hypothetical protein